MADILKGPDGNYYLKPPTARSPADLIPLSEADLEVVREGGAEAFLKAAGQQAGGIVGGALELGEKGTNALGLTDSTTFQEVGEFTRRQQDVRSRANPSASTLGNVAGMAPDVALGVLSGGTTLPGQMARAGAVEGTLGALRSPEDPLTGAAIQGTVGAVAPLAGPVTGALGKGARKGLEIGRNAVETVRGRSLSAAVNATPDMGATSERVLRGMLTPDEVLELEMDLSTGSLMTRGDVAALNARSASQIEAADALRQSEELYRSDVIADRIAGRGKSVNGIRDNGKNAATKVILSELGNPNAQRLTYAVIRDEFKAQSAVFQNAEQIAGDLKFEAPDVQKLIDVSQQASMDDADLVSAYMNDIMGDALGTGDGTATDVLASGKAGQYRNRLRKDIDRASLAGRMERVQSLTDIMDVLDDITERQAVKVDPGVGEALAEARYRWRILKSLDRSTATTDAAGSVNLKSFLTQYQARGNRAGKSTARNVRGKRFMDTLETLKFLTERVEPSSGTAQRLLAKASPVAGGASAVGALSVALGGE
jgi:hypothetical protein